MKFMLSLILMSMSFSVSAEITACESLIEEFKIPPAVNGEASMRKFKLVGKTTDGAECRIDFVPDFCTFQIGEPLESPLMYYLMGTDTSSVKMKFKRGEKFFLKAVTKESKEDGLGKFTKLLEISKGNNGYDVRYKLEDGVFFRTKLMEFRCNVELMPGPN